MIFIFVAGFAHLAPPEWGTTRNLVSLALVCYVMTTTFATLTSSKLYCFFSGTHRKLNIFLTYTFVPTVLMILYLIICLIQWNQEGSIVVSRNKMMLLMLWYLMYMLIYFLLDYFDSFRSVRINILTLGVPEKIKCLNISFHKLI